MKKRISDKIIIGNALICLNKEYLTKSDIYEYWNNVDSLLPEEYYTYQNNNSFIKFCEEHPFFVKRVGDTLKINCDISLLERYFRIGVPIEILNIFDLAGTKLNENDEIKQLNYDYENIKSLKNDIEKRKIGDKDGKAFKMLEKTGSPCDVKITEKSRKILAKTLLK